MDTLLQSNSDFTYALNDYSPQQAAPPPLPPSAYPPPLPSRVHRTPQLSPATSSFASTSSDYDPHEAIAPSSPLLMPSFTSSTFLGGHAQQPSSYPHTPQHKLAQRLESTTLSDHSPKHLLVSLPDQTSFYTAAGPNAGIMATKAAMRSSFAASLPPMAAPLSVFSPPNEPPSPASSDSAPFPLDEDHLPNGMTYAANGSPVGHLDSPDTSAFTTSWFSHDSHISPQGLPTHNGTASSMPIYLDDYLHSPNPPQVTSMQSTSGATAFRSNLSWMATQNPMDGGMSRSASAIFGGGGHAMAPSSSMPSFSVNPAQIAPSSSLESVAISHTGHTSLFSFNDDDDVAQQSPFQTVEHATTEGGPFQTDTIRASVALRSATTHGEANGNGVIDETVRGPIFTSPIRPSRPALSSDLFQQASAPSSLQSRSWSNMMSSPHGLLPSPVDGGRTMQFMTSPSQQLTFHHHQGPAGQMGPMSSELAMRTGKQPFKYKGKVPNWEELPTKRSRGRRPHQTSGQVRPTKLTKTGKPSTVYVCHVPACNGQVFQRSEHLKRHIASIHMDYKPHNCPAPGCDKKFSRKDNLRQHMKVHKDMPAGRPSLGMSRTSSSASNVSASSFLTAPGMASTGSAGGGIGAGLSAMNLGLARGMSSGLSSSTSASEDDDDEGSMDTGDDEADYEGEGDMDGDMDGEYDDGYERDVSGEATS